MKTVRLGDMVRHASHPNDRFEVWKIEWSTVHASSRWHTIEVPVSELEPWATHDSSIEVRSRWHTFRLAPFRCPNCDHEL